MNPNLFIIKLGGSLVVPREREFDKEYLTSFRNLLEKFIEKRKKFVVIIGGGKICRWYQSEASRICEASNSDRNWIGAYVTRVNAEVVNSFMRPFSQERAYYQFDQEIKMDKSILVVGAWKPETSTNMDAVRMAEKFGSKTLINLSNTDYVHDKDPNKFMDAKPIKTVSWENYEKIIEYEKGKEMVHLAGANIPFDIFATERAKKLGLKVIFTNGRNFENLERILEGKDFIGTRIG